MTRYARSGTLNAHVPWPRGDGSPEEPQKEAAPRQSVTYVCASGHAFAVVFALGAEVPGAWDCRCGGVARLEGTPAGTGNRPRLPGYGVVGNGRYDRACDDTAPRAQLAKRRTDAELEALLAEALAGLRQQRGVA